MGVNERIKEFIKHTGLSVSRFEKMCGLSNGYIANIKHGIGAMKLEVIQSRFPELNKDWLLYGRGEMIRQKSGNDIGEAGSAYRTGYEMGMADDIVSVYRLLCREKDMRIKDLEGRITDFGDRIEDLNGRIKDKEEIISILKKER